MAAPAMSREAFAEVWTRCGGSPQRVAEETGLNIRNVYRRRARMANDGAVLHTLETRTGHQANGTRWSPLAVKPNFRLNLDIADGVVIVFSDAHYWPGLVSVSHSALLAVIRALNPRILIANGDLLDGAAISRHGRSGWEQRPTIAQELATCKDRLAEVEEAAGKARLVWNLGNHDQRFENHFSANMPAAEGLPGTTLPEHFPLWDFAMSTVINAGSDHPVVVKHRNANGLHAAYNNTLRAGVSMVTGHLHRLLVTSWGDYRGRRYGIDTGCLANPTGPQFTYTEDAPSPHGEGFAVLTFRDSRLQPPELAEVVDGVAVFRGRPIAEKAEAA